MFPQFRVTEKSYLFHTNCRSSRDQTRATCESGSGTSRSAIHDNLPHPCFNHYLFYLSNVLVGKCLSGQMYFSANELLGKCLLNKWLSGQMSFRANVLCSKRLLHKCLSVQTSYWQTYYRYVLWANVVLGKYL
jgi:hypothetical protein